MSQMLLRLICVLLLFESCLAEDIPYIFDDNFDPMSPSESILDNKNRISSIDLAGVPNIPPYDYRISSGCKSGIRFGTLMDSDREDIDKLGASIVADYPGNHTIDQVCAIYDYLKFGNETVKGWSYVSDPLFTERCRYANETLLEGYGKSRSGIGDCDDFAILMASLVESIGGTPRIVQARNDSIGHAYTEVYLGEIGSQSNQINEILQWLRERYLLDKIYGHINPEIKEVWLNLDWGKDDKGNFHPGGPLFKADVHEIVALKEKIPLEVIRIHPTQSQNAILPGDSMDVVQLRQLNLGNSPAFHIEWSPDGKLLAIASMSDIDVFDTQNWDQKNQISTEGFVQCIAFSPDSKTIASVGSPNGVARLWDVASGGEKFALDSNYGGEYVVFSPDGKKVAVAVDMTAKIFDADNGQELDTLIGNGGHIYCLAISPYGHILASGESSNAIKLWNISNGTDLRIISGGVALSLAFSPYGLIIASGSPEGTITLWDVSSGHGRGTLSGHTGMMHGLAFSPNGRLMASASEDATVKLWDVANKRDLQTLKGHTKGVTSVAFSPDGSKLASASDDGTVRIWGVSE